MNFILAKNGGAFNPARVDYFQVRFNNITRKYDVVVEFAQDTLAVADFPTEDEAKNYIAQIVADLNKPAAHWIKTQRSELLNIDSYSCIQIQKYIGAKREDYCVVGYGKYDGERCTIQVVEDLDDAEKFLDDLLENLNS